MPLTVHISKLLLETIRKLHIIIERGVTSFNVMAACNFDLLLTFVMAGWEGAAHDTRIFLDAIRRQSINFPKPPPGI